MTPEAVAFSTRFRRVANRYALRVHKAYEGAQAKAMADTDEVVAATVAAWEAANGLDVTDWPTVGMVDEGRGEDRP